MQRALHGDHGNQRRANGDDLGVLGRRALVGNQECRGTVLQHVAHPFARVGGVQRHIGAARLEDGQHRGHVVAAALQQDADEVALSQAYRQQRVGQAIGRRVQIFVAQTRFTVDHRDRHGRAAALRLEQGVESLLKRVRRTARIEAVQHRMALIGIQHFDIAQAQTGLPGHASRGQQQLLDQALDRGRVIQLLRKPYLAADAAAGGFEQEGQVHRVCSKVDAGCVIGHDQRDVVQRVAVAAQLQAQDLRQFGYDRDRVRRHRRHLGRDEHGDRLECRLTIPWQAQGHQQLSTALHGRRTQPDQHAVFALVFRQQHRQQAGADLHVGQAPRRVRTLEQPHKLRVEFEAYRAIHAGRCRGALEVGRDHGPWKVLVHSGQPEQLIGKFAATIAGGTLRSGAGSVSHAIWGAAGSV